MNATYSCLLKAWHRTVKSGLCLNPTQFLILCDVLENPAEKISASQRAKRLRLTQPTVSLALRFLDTIGLATLIQVPATGGPDSHHRSYPALSATPTREAYQLFGLRGPYKTHAPA